MTPKGVDKNSRLWMPQKTLALYAGPVALMF
jgi:hypothetical protein